MENASKALLIAGGVLLSILIISLGVYLFANFGGVTAQIGENVEESQISQFNSQFTTNVGKKQYGFQKTNHTPPTGDDYYIAVTLQGKGQIEFGTETTNEDYINSYYNENLIIPQVNSINGSVGLTYYDVQVLISDMTQRVYQVICIPK